MMMNSCCKEDSLLNNDNIIEEDPMDLTMIINPNLEDKKEIEILLIDYYHKTIGTPTDETYEEIALYEYPDQSLILKHYTNEDTNSERCIVYKADERLYIEAMKIVNKYKLEKYEGKKGLDIEGVKKVIKFNRNRKDDVIRISIENIDSENDLKVFDEMNNLLRSYLNKDNMK